MMNRKEIENYLPADYNDTYNRVLNRGQKVSPREVLTLLFTHFPWWLGCLMTLRNIIVKPFGLKGGGFEEHLEGMIRFEDGFEIIFGMKDTHLTFFVSVWCSSIINDTQRVSLTTVVNYHNRFGRVYFGIIKPFHKLIVKSLLNRINS